MRARARVVATGDDRGGTRLETVRSEPPLVLRATPEALYLVGGAGGPLGGDDLRLDIEVGPGARLVIRTAAASVAQPGRGPEPSTVQVRATVAAGGMLHWLPEPVVAARGCDHHMTATISLHGDARLVWREEIILGRHHEAGGSVVTRNHVDLDGTALLRHELALGPLHPSAAGPAVTAGARAVGSVLLVGPSWGASERPLLLAATAVVLPLARSGAQVLALAENASTLRRHLEAGVASGARHTAGAPAP
jgi:urease accessory protein